MDLHNFPLILSFLQIILLRKYNQTITDYYVEK